MIYNEKYKNINIFQDEKLGGVRGIECLAWNIYLPYFFVN
jgi:hypothetical protein